MKEIFLRFIEYEKRQKKTIRGEATMYDIKGHYKYLTLSELFNFYTNQ